MPVANFGYNLYRLGWFMVLWCFLKYPGAPEGSTGSGSDLKASQKTGSQIKISSDRLEEAENRTCEPWFTRHRLIPYTTTGSRSKELYFTLK